MLILLLSFHKFHKETDVFYIPHSQKPNYKMVPFRTESNKRLLLLTNKKKLVDHAAIMRYCYFLLSMLQL